MRNKFYQIHVEAHKIKSKKIKFRNIWKKKLFFYQRQVFLVSFRHDFFNSTKRFANEFKMNNFLLITSLLVSFWDHFSLNLAKYEKVTSKLKESNYFFYEKQVFLVSFWGEFLSKLTEKNKFEKVFVKISSTNCKPKDSLEVVVRSFFIICEEYDRRTLHKW
jgi:hypothetical protein